MRWYEKLANPRVSNMVSDGARKKVCDGVVVAFDLPTLSFAVVLVMAISSLALTAHWLANMKISGLGEVAVGTAAFSLGSCLLFDAAGNASAIMLLLGDALTLMGLMWIWLGIAGFWKIRNGQLVFLVGAVVALALVSLGYQSFEGASVAERAVTLFLFTAALSLGVVRSLVQALGGRQGFYKGIVRRTTVGVGIAAGLFLVHAVFSLYAAASIIDQASFAGSVYPVVSKLEALAFVLLLALVIIIMTAERLQAELKIQEMMDPLTRALNRRAFLEVMKAVLARARRLADPVSVIMIDIDKFKQVNLTHGRVTGDKALVEFANLVMEGRRSQDVFCRFGGEEFVLMLPGTPEEGADLVAARIKSTIEKTTISPTGVPIKLTISMGVVTARGDDLDADGMLDVVDRRMHRAQKLLFQTIETAS